MVLLYHTKLSIPNSIESIPCHTKSTLCTVLPPDVKPEMIQKIIEKKRNQPGGYIGVRKWKWLMGQQDGSSSFCIRSKAFKSLFGFDSLVQSGVWAHPVRMRVSVSDSSCESRYLCSQSKYSRYSRYPTA